MVSWGWGCICGWTADMMDAATAAKQADVCRSRNLAPAEFIYSFIQARLPGTSIIFMHQHTQISIQILTHGAEALEYILSSLCAGLS